ncbi:MAG TPA: CHAD domain-containing protein [Bacteroidota bacterium]|nr:CHAD domain-containing protein [Bacteroidota bacterium]
MARAWKIEGLNPDQFLKTSLPKILRLRFDEMWSYLDDTIEGKDVNPLHDMRVSARRLQALLRIFRDALPKKKVDRQIKVIRDLVRHLGGVREHDVFLDALLDYKKGRPDGDERSVDLMIAREKSLRVAEQSALRRYLLHLRRAEYDHIFKDFVRDAT